MSDSLVAERLGLIEGLILRPGARDVASVGRAVRGQFSRMVHRLADMASKNETIALVTGAYMAWASPAAAETDGPVGTAILAAALKTLGARPLLVTDSPAESLAAAAIQAVGLDAGDLIVVDTGASEEDIRRIFDSLGAAYIVAIERIGPNRKGRALTMRSYDITEFTAPLHVAFEQHGILTGAIGDGGNEIGMGGLRISDLAGPIPNAPEIACRTRVDDLVVAGTSNWGCYGIVAGLALACEGSTDQLSRLLLPSCDEAVMSAVVSAGGIDGVTGRAGMSVDGVRVEDYRELLLALGGTTS